MDRPFEIRVIVPGDRAWCVERLKEVRTRLQEAAFEVTALPSVDVRGEPAELCLTWSDLVFANGWTALSVAQAAGFTVMPELENVPAFRIELQAQDPDHDRRRPQGA